MSHACKVSSLISIKRIFHYKRMNILLRFTAPSPEFVWPADMKDCSFPMYTVFPCPSSNLVIDKLEFACRFLLSSLWFRSRC